MPVGRNARGLVELMRAASLTAGLVERVGQPLSVSWYTAHRHTILLIARMLEEAL